VLFILVPMKRIGSSRADGERPKQLPQLKLRPIDGTAFFMKTVIVAGSSGLIGAEACRFFSVQGYRVVGVDNDMRAYFSAPKRAPTGADAGWNLS
jgi:hypothetical protein